MFDKSTKHVSFDKSHTGLRFVLTAGLLQREVLDIADDWSVMEGYAEHDKHYLKYTRKRET
jgi:hypothetical protein